MSKLSIFLLYFFYFPLSKAETREGWLSRTHDDDYSKFKLHRSVSRRGTKRFENIENFLILFRCAWRRFAKGGFQGKFELQFREFLFNGIFSSRVKRNWVLQLSRSFIARRSRRRRVNDTSCRPWYATPLVNKNPSASCVPAQWTCIRLFFFSSFFLSFSFFPSSFFPPRLCCYHGL